MNNCATCRWWVKREMDSDAIAKIEGLQMLQDTPENRRYVAMCSGIARENLKHGIGDCHGVPQTIEKSGADFCGQWKGREEQREVFFEALGEIFTPPTDEQREKAEQALKELLGEWRR